MKNRILKIVTISLCIAAAQVMHAERLFGEVSRQLPEVESVYIGKAMIRMAGSSLNQMNTGIDNIMIKKAALENINAIEVINCEKESLIERLRVYTRHTINKHKLEILMEQKTQDESTIIYGRTVTQNGEQQIQNLIIENCSHDSYQLIHIDGFTSPETMNIRL